MTINIIGANNGVGLTQDANILKDVFESHGVEVKVLEFWAFKRTLPPKADVNIMLELFDSRLCNAKRNYLIPNQEWFLDKWVDGLKALDAVLCKTKHAEEIFSQHAKCHYISFTSRYAGYKKSPDKRFVHLRGRSATKGTLELLQAYKKYKGLPELLIHMTRAFKKEEAAKIKKLGLEVMPNVKYSKSRLPESEYDNLMSSSLFHVCPSPCEGFGHYINEPMGSGCIVLTTNAPPMNELCNTKNSILFGYSHASNHYLGIAFSPKTEEIAAAIDCAASLSDSRIEDLRANAVESYNQRKAFFIKSIEEIIL